MDIGRLVKKIERELGIMITKEEPLMFKRGKVAVRIEPHRKGHRIIELNRLYQKAVRLGVLYVENGVYVSTLKEKHCKLFPEKARKITQRLKEGYHIPKEKCVPDYLGDIARVVNKYIREKQRSSQGSLGHAQESRRALGYSAHDIREPLDAIR